MKALIYGHSQSGGMGKDLEKALKKLGGTVTRVTKVGWNDSKLLSYLPSLPAGPYTHVFLYAGGNSDNPTPDQINKLIAHFKGANVSVILPPVNTERTKKGGAAAIAALRAKNAGNKQGIRDVRVYETEGTLKDFEPDQIHMRPGSAASKTLAQKILENLGLTATAGAPAAPSSSSAATVGIALAVVGVAFLLLRRG